MASFTFNPNDLQRLNRLVFTTRSSATTDPSGNRRSRRAGDGIDFLDYRPYVPGDDVRKVDWSVYGRLRQLFVRLNESPRQLSVTFLIDASRSMSFGSPVSKLEQAQRLACALGFVAMRGGDRVYAYSFASRISGSVGPLTGARGLASLVRYLKELEPKGDSDLAGALAQVQAAGRHRGLVVVLSDFLNVDAGRQSMHAIPASGGTVLAVQVLDRDDWGDGLQGSLRLRDSESGRLVDVKINRQALDRFRRAFEADRVTLESTLTGPGRHYLLASTRDHYLELVCRALRAKAVLR